MTDTVKVIIVAAGEGKRLGARTPKQFCTIHGSTVLEHTIATFQSMKEIGEIIIVLPERYLETYSSRLSKRFGKIARIVAGGKKRSDSVLEGYRAAGEASVYLIHDGVRPCVNRSLIREIISTTRRYGAAIAAVKVHDTVKETGARGFISRTIDREKLYLAQTPQGFTDCVARRIMKKRAREGRKTTDESSIAERSGIRVKIVESDDSNLKITTANDLKLARKIMRKV